MVVRRQANVAHVLQLLRGQEVTEDAQDVGGAEDGAIGLDLNRSVACVGEGIRYAGGRESVSLALQRKQRMLRWRRTFQRRQQRAGLERLHVAGDDGQRRSDSVLGALLRNEQLGHVCKVRQHVLQR
jgi:hypothetical protein